MKMNMAVKGSCEVANFPQRDFVGVCAGEKAIRNRNRVRLSAIRFGFYGQVAAATCISRLKPKGLLEAHFGRGRLPRGNLDP
jgi:hypothetical protein